MTGQVPTTCARCGAVDSAGAALGWSAEIDQTATPPHTRWLCPSCTRDNVRLIEAKLDQQWW